ncbi:MAG: chloride channel protein [Anaerolineae bacterium]
MMQMFARVESFMSAKAKKRIFTFPLRYFRSYKEALLIFLAVTVGAATAMALWGFRVGIEFFHELFQEELAHHTFAFLGDFGIVLALALAGLIVGAIMQRFVGHERYHGVAAIMESVALAGGRLKYRVIPFKSLASALSLGAGASVGPEDPSVQIGSNIGSFLGQRLQISEEQIRLLVSAGAASAISAAFNAPIAGVFFALEVVLHGELAAGSVSVIILAAVMSAGITQGLGIGEAAMGPFDFTLGSAVEVPFFAPLGLLLAPFAVGFIRTSYWQGVLWHKVIQLPTPLKTALGGLIVGLVGVYVPEILGGGREVMNQVFNGEVNYAFGFLLVLGVLKIILTTLSISAGFVGGIFAPSLFIGTMLGAAYGAVITDIIGTGAGDPRNYAVAGMAGMMAGVVRAPITAIMLVFELTNDYRFILPIMLVAVVCIFVTAWFEKYGMYEKSLVRAGVHLPQGRDIDLMQGVTVAEAMYAPAPTIHENATLIELRDTLRHHHRHALCVVDDDGTLNGIVTLSDLQRAYTEDPEGTPHKHVGDVCTRDVLTVSPDDVLWSAIRQMGARDVGRLPVVEPRSNTLVGMLNRHDIVDAYNTAIQRKFMDQKHAEQVRLNTLTGAHVYEMHVHSYSIVANKCIRDVQWPPETIVASVIRKGKMIVPHGYTELKTHDTLMIVADPHAERALESLFGYKISDSVAQNN